MTVIFEAAALLGALAWYYFKLVFVEAAVLAVIYILAAAIYRVLDKLFERRNRHKRIRGNARRYELRRDRERVDFGEYDREGAEYRRRREREMLGKPEPLRKAVGLFSGDAAQRVVRS